MLSGEDIVPWTTHTDMAQKHEVYSVEKANSNYENSSHK